MMKRLLCLALLTLPALAEPKVSWHQLPTSNGLTVAVYNDQEDRVDTVWPHLFRDYDATHPVQPWLQNLRWHKQARPTKVSYRENTHVIEVDYPDLQVFLYAPFEGDHHRLALSLRGPARSQARLSFTGNAQVQEWTLPDERRIALGPKPGDIPPSPEAEAKRMRTFYTRTPEGLTRKERNLFEQSIAILKMGQVSPQEEPEPARGQIVASLPPGKWNIGWLRDATYSILALDRLGLHDEARRALLFFLKAKGGLYEHYVWTDGVDYGVKTPYLLTVCRYFGPGVEESDFNEFGPNIELDGFGLFLTALTDYVTRSNDRSLLDSYRGTIDRLVADVILTLIEPEGIIRAESGPWEMHLPGRHQVWTSVVSAAGLQDYGTLVHDDRYLHAAQLLRQGIAANFVHEGRFLKGYTEATTPTTLDFWDGGTIEAFTLGVLTDPRFFQTHYQAYEQALKLPRRGFARLNNPDPYTCSEWPFLSLRNAQALMRFGRPGAADPLIARITDYSALNYNQIAELYGRQDESYGGEIPMVGYGAGAYVLALMDRKGR